jgi:integration host factor subunit beta
VRNGVSLANITKQDLIHEIARSTGYIQADIKAVVEETLRSVTEYLNAGNTIEVRGFGTFTTKARKPRPARNPRTGDIVLLEQRIAPLFKFSAELKKQINDAWVQSMPISTQQITPKSTPHPENSTPSL